MSKKLILIALCISYASGAVFYHNNVGKLHLTEQKWDIQYVFNLTEYKETSKVLHECIRDLKNICTDGQNPLCKYFERATEKISSDIDADFTKLDTFKRSKRFIVFIPVILGITVVAFWAGMMVEKSAINSIRDEIRDNIDMIEQAANLTISALDTMDNMTRDNNKIFSYLQNAIENNTRNIEIQKRISNIINIVSLSAQMHEKMQIKLNDVFYGDVHSRLFEVIDFGEFLKTKAIIN